VEASPTHVTYSRINGITFARKGSTAALIKVWLLRYHTAHINTIRNVLRTTVGTLPPARLRWCTIAHLQQSVAHSQKLLLYSPPPHVDALDTQLRSRLRQTRQRIQLQASREQISKRDTPTLPHSSFDDVKCRSMCDANYSRSATVAGQRPHCEPVYECPSPLSRCKYTPAPTVHRFVPHETVEYLEK
jgi:hypothetical protein